MKPPATLVSPLARAVIALEQALGEFRQLTKLSAQQAHALLLIHEEGGFSTVQAFGERFDLNRVTVARNLARLKDLGFIATRRSATNLRARNISVTPKGEEALRAFSRLLDSGVKDLAPILTKHLVASVEIAAEAFGRWAPCKNHAE